MLPNKTRTGPIDKSSTASVNCDSLLEEWYSKRYRAQLQYQPIPLFGEMANRTILQIAVVAFLLACAVEQSTGLPLGEREDKDTTILDYAPPDNATATSNTSDDNEDTDLPDDLTTGKEAMLNALTGPIEVMNILSNLFEDQDSYDLLTGNTEDDRSQDNVIVLSSEEDEHEALPEVNFIPLMGNPVVQDPGMLEEIPIIQEVVISHPNEYSETRYMDGSMEPLVMQEQMVDIMEEASQFVNRIMQAMKNRFRPLAHDEWMVPDTQEHNHNMPLTVVSVDWQETAKDNAANDVAEIGLVSHGAATGKADTPSVQDADDKSNDVEATEQKTSSALEPEAKPEEKVLIRTERVTNPKDLPADKPIFHVIQHQKESAEGGKSKIM